MSMRLPEKPEKSGEKKKIAKLETEQRPNDFYALGEAPVESPREKRGKRLGYTPSLTVKLA